MSAESMSAEQIVGLGGAILYAINMISAAIPNKSNSAALQKFLDVVNLLSFNIGRNKNAE